MTGNEFGDHNSNVVKLYSVLIVDGKPLLHEAVREKLKVDPDYKPPNLPQSSSIEPRNAASSPN